MMQNNFANLRRKLLKKIIIIIIIGIMGVIIIKSNILPRIYPKEYSEYVEKYSKENNLDPLWIYSIIKAESNFRVDAKSTSNAIGLMQIMLSTAQEIGTDFQNDEITEEKLYDAELNIQIGTAYFRSLMDKYNNVNLALIAYNAGMGNLDNWLEQGIIDKQGENIDNIPYAETRNYVKRIIQNYKVYNEIY